jgi:hypothetical protein
LSFAQTREMPQFVGIFDKENVQNITRGCFIRFADSSAGP